MVPYFAYLIILFQSRQLPIITPRDGNHEVSSKIIEKSLDSFAPRRSNGTNGAVLICWSSTTLAHSTTPGDGG
jgi:hypothetical protein